MSFLTWIKGVCGVVCGLASYVWGGLDGLLTALIICIIIDYITGVCAAAYQGKLNSSTGFRGIIKKVVILLIVALAYTIGHVVGMDSIRDLVIGFYIANEGISIMENAGRMDIPCTGKLKTVLEQLKKE